MQPDMTMYIDFLNNHIKESLGDIYYRKVKNIVQEYYLNRKGNVTLVYEDNTIFIELTIIDTFENESIVWTDLNYEIVFYEKNNNVISYQMFVQQWSELNFHNQYIFNVTNKKCIDKIPYIPSFDKTQNLNNIIDTLYNLTGENFIHQGRNIFITLFSDLSAEYKNNYIYLRKDNSKDLKEVLLSV